MSTIDTTSLLGSTNSDSDDGKRDLPSHLFMSTLVGIPAQTISNYSLLVQASQSDGIGNGDDLSDLSAAIPFRPVINTDVLRNIRLHRGYSYAGVAFVISGIALSSLGEFGRMPVFVTWTAFSVLFLLCELSAMDRFLLRELPRRFQWNFLLVNMLAYAGFGIASQWHSRAWIDVLSSIAAHFVTVVFAFVILCLDAASFASVKFKVVLLALFLAKGILLLVLDYVQPYYDETPICVIVCSDTRRIALSSLTSMLAFGTKYLMSCIADWYNGETRFSVISFCVETSWMYHSVELSAPLSPIDTLVSARISFGGHMKQQVQGRSAFIPVIAWKVIRKWAQTTCHQFAVITLGSVYILLAFWQGPQWAWIPTAIVAVLLLLCVAAELTRYDIGLLNAIIRDFECLYLLGNLTVHCIFSLWSNFGKDSSDFANTSMIVFIFWISHCLIILFDAAPVFTKRLKVSLLVMNLANACRLILQDIIEPGGHFNPKPICFVICTDMRAVVMTSLLNMTVFMAKYLFAVLISSGNPCMILRLDIAYLAAGMPRDSTSVGLPRANPKVGTTRVHVDNLIIITLCAADISAVQSNSHG